MVAMARTHLLALVGAVLICAGCGAQTPAGEPVAIGTRLQLFLDYGLIDRASGVRLTLHSPQRREVVFVFDAAWEGPECAYVTMMNDAGRFRMYYRGGGENTMEVTCLAESTDGIRWTRPELGIVEFEGSRANNIIWTGRTKSYWESHNFVPFRDENPYARPDERYKAVALGRYPDETGETRKMLVALVSPDGVRWRRLREEPVITSGSFDSQNVAFYDTVQNLYVCYFREGRDGKRSIRRATSADFTNWSQPEWLEFGGAPPEHFYTNSITPYFRAPDTYLGFPMRFVPERKEIGDPPRAVDALSDAVLIASRDGVNFSRSFMEAYIRPGLEPANWGNGHGNNTPAWGLLPTSPEEISIYWMENFGATPQMRRGSIRTDGFVSVRAGYEGGDFVTRPLVFEGDELVINYSTSAVGSVRVEIQDSNGNPIPGLALEDCVEIYGDEIERVVRWKNARAGIAAGRVVKLRFAMKDADLFSIRFRE